MNRVGTVVSSEDKKTNMSRVRRLISVNTRRVTMPKVRSKHSFAVIFLVYLMINLGLDFGETLVAPFAKSLNATPVLIGVVATGFTYGSIVFRIVSGPAIDYFNRKMILVTAVVIIAISFLGEAFATSVPVLVFFRIIQGIGQAFTAPVCLTLAAGVISRKKIASGIGTLAIARGIATLVAPVVALKISEVTSYQTGFILATVIELTAIIAVLNIPASSSKRTSNQLLKISVTDVVAKEALVPALLQFFFMLAWSCVFAFLVIYGQAQGFGSNIGFFNTVYGLAVFAAAPLGGYLVDRFGYYMLIPMLVLMAGSLWLLSFATNMWWLLTAAVVGAFGYGAAGPVARSMAVSVVSENRRGAASSTLFVASDIGQLVGPVIGGLIIARFGYTMMFRVAPVWIVAATVLLIITKQQVQRKAAAVTDMAVQDETDNVA